MIVALRLIETGDAQITPKKVINALASTTHEKHAQKKLHNGSLQSVPAQKKKTRRFKDAPCRACHKDLNTPDTPHLEHMDSKNSTTTPKVHRKDFNKLDRNDGRERMERWKDERSITMPCGKKERDNARNAPQGFFFFCADTMAREALTRQDITSTVAKKNAEKK